MKKLKLALLIGTLLGSSLQAANIDLESYSKMSLEQREADFSRIVIKLNEGVEISEVESFLGTDVKLVRNLSLGYKVILVEGKINIDDLSNSDLVESASIDGIIKSIPIEKSDIVLGNVSAKTLSNDPYLTTQKYMESVSTYKGASSISRAIEEKQQKNVQIKIGVIDTGVLQHEDVVFQDGQNFSTVFEEDRNRSDGYVDITNVDDGFSNILKCTSGHGLSVSSIIAALTDNNKGISGIVGAQLVAARAFGLDCNNLSAGTAGYTSDVADSIVWLSGGTIEDIDDIDKKVDIINLSIGTTESCTIQLQQAIDFAIGNNVLVVGAAGNEDSDVDLSSPANCDGIISVGSNNTSANKSTISNFGKNITVTAIGENVTVAGKLTNNYYTDSGTSFSAPVVTGILGLVKEKYNQVNQAEVKYLIEETATEHGTDFSGSSDDCLTDQRCGAGVINAYNTLSLADQLFGFSSSLSHYYEGFESCEEETYLTKMSNLGVNVCDIHNLTINEIENYTDVKYQIITRDAAANTWTDNNTTVVKEIFMLSGDSEINYKIKEIDSSVEYGIRVCDLNDNCFNSQDLDFTQVSLPKFCD
jgi:serine protease